jgi:hypothetical protein
VVVVPHKKYLPQEIKILDFQGGSQIFHFETLVGILRINIGIKKSSFPFQFKGDIKYLTSLTLYSLKYLFHLQKKNVESKTNDKHGNHHA